MPNKRNLTMLIAALALAGGGYALYEPRHEHESGHGQEHGHAHEDGHKEETRISDHAAGSLNIQIEEATGATIYETLSVSGRVTLNQNSTAQVKARFPGIVRSTLKEPGEIVTAGEVLATVESNESLQVYAVRAPVSGTIIARNANTGELAGDAPLFVIADLSRLWAELFVFSRDGEKLKAGQKVRIQCLDDPIHTDAAITLILPTAEAASQTVVARAVIDNTDGHWRPGMNILGRVVLAEKDVKLAVRNEAIQRMDGRNVVFVQEGTAYKAQPVETGTQDAEWTEIKSGLDTGQRYVAKNSFIVKADMEKSSAGHEH